MPQIGRVPLVMKLDDAEVNSKSWSLGFSAAMTIVAGYYGKLVVTGDFSPRWICWFVSMIFFCYIVYELLVGLAAATAQEKDLEIRGKIQTAQVMTAISWYCAETQPELLRQRYEATEPAAMVMRSSTENPGPSEWAPP